MSGQIQSDTRKRRATSTSLRMVVVLFLGLSSTACQMGSASGLASAAGGKTPSNPVGGLIGQTLGNKSGSSLLGTGGASQSKSPLNLGGLGNIGQSLTGSNVPLPTQKGPQASGVGRFASPGLAAALGSAGQKGGITFPGEDAIAKLPKVGTGGGTLGEAYSECYRTDGCP